MHSQVVKGGSLKFNSLHQLVPPGRGGSDRHVYSLNLGGKTLGASGVAESTIQNLEKLQGGVWESEWVWHVHKIIT